MQALFKKGRSPFKRWRQVQKPPVTLLHFEFVDIPDDETELQFVDILGSNEDSVRGSSELPPTPLSPCIQTSTIGHICETQSDSVTVKSPPEESKQKEKMHPLAACHKCSISCLRDFKQSHKVKVTSPHSVFGFDASGKKLSFVNLDPKETVYGFKADDRLPAQLSLQEFKQVIPSKVSCLA